MTTTALSHDSKKNHDATLLDVDLPFLKVLTRASLLSTGQAIEFLLCGNAYRVWVLPVHEVEDGATWVRLGEEDRIATILERLFLQQGIQNREAERRNVSRIRTSLSVRSPDLPGCRATTFDISETGLRLVTERPVPNGTRLRLSVSDSVGLVDVQGETVWSSPRINSLFHVGVRLINHQN